jgi:hypothetical protein
MEELARMLAQGSTDPLIIEHAREAAHAQSELATLRKLWIAWVHRTYWCGNVERKGQRLAYIIAMLSSQTKVIYDSVATMPPPGPDRLAEAIRRAMPELMWLARYEDRAIARRDRAIREIQRRLQFQSLATKDGG